MSFDSNSKVCRESIANDRWNEPNVGLIQINSSRNEANFDINASNLVRTRINLVLISANES